MRYRTILRLVGGALVGALAAACVTAAPAGVAPSTPKAVSIQATALPSEGPSPATPADSWVATPTARRGLEATDPTAVQLAAGRPILVEFFAFW